MKFLTRQFSLSKCFLAIVTTWIISVLLLFIFFFRSSPTAISFNDLNQLVDEKKVSYLSFQSDSQELIGNAKDFNFVYKGPLSKNLYLKILDQKMTSSAFLGPVTGFGEKSEFESDYNFNEDLIYDVEAMGLNAGLVQFRSRGFGNDSTDESFIASVSLRTRREFSIYSVDDLLFSRIRRSDLLPISFEHRKQQTQINGVAQIHYAPDALSADYLEEAVSKRNGLSKEQKNLQFQFPMQNAVSIFYKLRTMRPAVGETVQTYLHDQQKEFQLVIKNLGVESFFLNGFHEDVNHLEILVSQVGQVREPLSVAVMMSRGANAKILSIEARTKIGLLRMRIQAGSK